MHFLNDSRRKPIFVKKLDFFRRLRLRFLPRGLLFSTPSFSPGYAKPPVTEEVTRLRQSPGYRGNTRLESPGYRPVTIDWPA